MWAYPPPADDGHHGHHGWEDPQYYDGPPELAQHDGLHLYEEGGHNLGLGADEYAVPTGESGYVSAESGDVSAPTYAQYSDAQLFADPR